MRLLRMPSTRNRSRLSDQSGNKFTASDFEKKVLARVKRCKLKAKKALNSKKISEQFDEEDEGMAQRVYYILILQKIIIFCHCLINFNRHGTKVKWFVGRLNMDRCFCAMDSFLGLYGLSLNHRPLQSYKLNYSFNKEALNYNKSFSGVFFEVSSQSLYAVTFALVELRHYFA